MKNIAYVEDQSGKYVCYKCGTVYKNDTYFYKSNSDFFSGIGKIPCCKDCLNAQYQLYYIKYRSVSKAMQRICMIYDYCYDDKVLEKCLETGTFSVGDYIKRINSRTGSAKTFEINFEEGINQAGSMSDMDSDPDRDSNIDPKIIKKWGKGFRAEDYETLREHYDYLKKSNPNCDSNQEIFINDLCYTKMQQLRAVREGRVDDYNKLTESYRKTFTQAGLKTVQDSNMNEDFSFGVTAEMIEKYTPAEYYKDKSLYKDFDGLGTYIDNKLLRPLKNLMFGFEDRDPVHYVKEESDGDVDEDED